jgi:hypothetical protein
MVLGSDQQIDELATTLERLRLLAGRLRGLLRLIRGAAQNHDSIPDPASRSAWN